MLTFIRRKLAQHRLTRLVKPDMDYAKHCAAQLPPERRERFLRNLGMM